ncbi:MAG TPA: carboxypeptidase regulatory-like domain-containing protein [Edaphocola sp.]|nr:carboxypeptidase regulatory-like domain-containing protein [Edaphocola sp.]
MPRYFVPLLTVLLFNVFLCQSQSSIIGTVKDDLGNVLMGASVTIKNQDSSAFLNYDISDSNGNFSIDVRSEALNLVLSVSYLGYKTVNKTIENKSQNIAIVLESSPEELKEVLIKFDNIEKRGDTLSYSVSAFKDQKDRSIADVIKKMPGISVMPNGQIYYMGNPIEKYYIEGMDMLEGRYNLANDNISADDVSKVQILENHQPIKVLDSLVYSERTSLNIKLKNNVSVSGSAEVGAGFNPILFNTNITPLVFTKKSQMLVSYQYNNTGNDLSRSINDFSTPNNVVDGFSASKKNILSLQQLSKPPFATSRWLDNNDHLGNFDYLHRLKNGTDLKVNLSYLNGIQTDNGTRNTTYITQDDTINIKENIENIIFSNSLSSKLTLEKNQSKSYLRNAFSFKAFWDSQRGTIVNEGLDIFQKLSNPYVIATNELKIIKPIGEQLITFSSNTGYTKTDQELMIAPGQFESILNDGQPYISNKQQSAITTFFSENKAGFTKKLGIFSFAPEVGFAYKKQQLTSDLFKTIDGNPSPIGPDYQNDIELTNSNFFLTSLLSLKQDGWQISLRSPLYLRYFTTDNNTPNPEKTIKKLNFEPNVSITKKLSPYWEAQIGANMKNRFGDIDNLFDAYILKNYLSLLRYNSTLSEQTSYASSLNIRYRNALKALFASVSLSLTKNDNNLLYKNSIADDGSWIIESVEIGNKVTTQNINVNTSKYFSKIKTTVTANGRFSFSEYPQIINTVSASLRSATQAYDLNIDSEITKWFSLGGSTSFMTSKLSHINDQSNTVKNWKSAIKTFFYLNENEIFNIDAEHYYNQIATSTNNNYFLNLSYQWTLKKYKLDAKMVWNNVLNTKNYINVSNGEFFSNENIYVLRPSQLLVSLRFSL